MGPNRTSESRNGSSKRPVSLQLLTPNPAPVRPLPPRPESWGGGVSEPIYASIDRSSMTDTRELERQVRTGAERLWRALVQLRKLRTPQEAGLQLVTLILSRLDGSLGFHLVGGHGQGGSSPDSLLVSHVVPEGAAAVAGIQLYDSIVSVNGRDLSHATHEQAVEAFRSAVDPIVVEVVRKTTSGSGGNDVTTAPRDEKSGVTISTQTDEPRLCTCGVHRCPTPPPATVMMNGGCVSSGCQTSMTEACGCELGCGDDLRGACCLEEPCLDTEFDEVVLERGSLETVLGLTLCYGATTADVYVQEIASDSPAGRCASLREGDQIVQVDGADVVGWQQAMSLFSHAGTEVSLLVSRPWSAHSQGETTSEDDRCVTCLRPKLEQVDEESESEDAAQSECQSHDKDSGVGHTDNSTRNDESSEQDLNELDLSELDGDATQKEVTKLRVCELALPPPPAMTPEEEEKDDSATDMGLKDGVGSLEGELEALALKVREMQLHCGALASHTGELSHRHVPKMGVRGREPTRDTSTPIPLTRQGSFRSEVSEVLDPLVLEFSDSCAEVGSQLSLRLKGSRVKVSEEEGEKELDEFYSQFTDVMYTDQENLAHTIALQQRLFQRALIEHAQKRRGSVTTLPSDSDHRSPALSDQHTEDSPSGNLDSTIDSTPNSHLAAKWAESCAQSPVNGSPGDHGRSMEWVLKRRADGSRYVTRRPVRSRLLRERAKKLEEQRRGMTTDEDTMSEMKMGKYFTREQRRQHHQKHQKRRHKSSAPAAAPKAPTIVQMSRRKQARHARVPDDFTTLQEVLAHGCGQVGGANKALFSVTTV